MHYDEDAHIGWAIARNLSAVDVKTRGGVFFCTLLYIYRVRKKKRVRLNFLDNFETMELNKEA